jgi:penicillin-binding protein 2
MSFLGQEEQIREFQDRFRFLYAVLFIGLGALTLRMVHLQILRGDQMRQFSEENRIKKVKIAAPRGMIFDRNRKLLIDNRPAFDLEIVPQYLRESKRADDIIAQLATLASMPEEEIRSTLNRARGQPSFLPVKIKTDLSREEVALIESWRIDMPGVQVQEEIKRTNLYGEVASHLLGYIGEVNERELPRLQKKGLQYKLGDTIGKFGLEKQMESYLRGNDGEKLVEVDALGRIKLDEKSDTVLANVNERPAVPGKNLVLTIDQDLQLAAVKAFENKIGSLVAIDPRTGEILAMISRPSFDPTQFARGISTELWKSLLANENRPMRDKTLQDHYPPGSTFKIITAITGLEEGVIDENTTFRCGGSIKLGNRTVHCHLKGGHGEVNVVSALQYSCDVFFYRLAMKLKSVDEIANWARHLGFGRKTGINLEAEAPGLIPTEEWKMKRFGQVWNTGETLSVAIGQSFVLTTALQLANAYASMANGGTLFRPSIVKEIESADGQILKQFSPEIMDQTRLKPKTVEAIKKGLWAVVNGPRGTGYGLRLPGMDFVGKSGTVQVVRIAADKIYNKCDQMKFKLRHHGVFAGYAPAKDPVIAVAVIGEHVCGGSSGAGPIVREVIKTYLEKYYPELYAPKVLATRLKESGQSIVVPKVRASDEEDLIVDPALPAGDEAAPTAVPAVEESE